MGWRTILGPGVGVAVAVGVGSWALARATVSKRTRTLKRIWVRSHRSRPFALLASWPTTVVLEEYGEPRPSASGALPPNPHEGAAPSTPQLFVWIFLRGGRPCDPQRPRRPD